MKKMKEILFTIYGVVMLLLFALACGFAEGECWLPAYSILGVIALMASFLRRLFPEQLGDDKV